MKYTKYVIVFVFLLLITGCKSVEISQTEFKSAIDENFTHMTEISANELKNVYGLNLDNFKEYTFKISYNNPLNAYVFVLPNGSNRKALKEIDKFFDYLLKINDENKERIKNKLEENIDDYLIHIVSDKNKEIYEKLEKKFKPVDDKK